MLAEIAGEQRDGARVRIAQATLHLPEGAPQRAVDVLVPVHRAPGATTRAGGASQRRLAAEHRTRLLATFALLAVAVGAALHWPEQATLVTCAASESRKA